MSEFVISTRYANALISKSEDDKSFDKVLSDVKFIKETIESSKELRNFLSNPIISHDNKLSALKLIFDKFIGEEVSNFIEFLISKGRENLLLDICKRFKELSDEKLNQSDVNITSAVELNDTQKREIETRLEKIIGKKVIPNFSIDSEIIGGFKARFGDTVIDASIKHQIELLKKKLFEESHYKN
ncbi:MAG: ATP synthase F1 subunit delta [Melioribacteraceae bacterium]|nr:ATP synthase F1 subunit delta [Melioribacteraceae bacterium]